ncbi:putative ABC transport system substrate-binding protein [Alkalibacillus filiformis]|uniref:ABC transport system substrate-binding protein n=1 Tax=Alkalibacillus filiformis TaxID=200990 RepID=A0ABU0DSH1_9BACI|nr:ABC transporter substrate-binding protein [Alkalibacillus filiformis]MDQ0351394.1 putative ABC transport system substrate-binding protein [Alkalibacillus filiformis]
MKKVFQLLFVALVGMLLLVACGDGEDNGGGDEGDAGGETFHIGATQIVQHPSLDRAYEGFQDALEDAGLNVEYDFQDAQNDPNNVKPISDAFVADGVDLIFTNSTPSTQGAYEATKDIPIVFTSVTDAEGAGVIESMENPGTNVTGVLDLHPGAIDATVEFIDQYFEGAGVGLIYNAGEPNSVAQIEAIESAAEGTSLTLHERTVANASEVQQAATTLVSDIDVFFVVTDNTVVEALDSVIGVANNNEIPLITGEPDSVAKGGFATFGIDYYTIGYRSGEMAVEILTGEKEIGEIPAEHPPEIQLFINEEAAELQGVEWHDDWDDEAQFIEPEEEE